MAEAREEGEQGSRELRHRARTHLNHLVGYGEVLREESREAGLAALSEDYDFVARRGLSLREAALAFFRGPEEGGPEPEERADREREAYSILYEIITRIQDAKGRVAGLDRLPGQERPALLEGLLRDTERMLEAANAVIGLLEEGFQPAAPGGAEPETCPGGSAPDRAARTGHILVVDDDLFNREILSRHLERQGHEVSVADDGAKGLALLEDKLYDVIILDVMMPGMNGYQFLERIKSNERTASIHVIVISALDDTESIARCIQLGAEDYLPREFEPVILKARIESCLEKKSLKEKEALYTRAVLETERRLRAELQEGAAYVRSLLPRLIQRQELSTDWVFIPSLSLGGDVFGYHPIGGAKSGRRLALYLIDVSGHGIEAALFSVTLMNLLKSQSLPGADFADPSSVLGRLNASFRMEEQNNLYFTAWYGVWDPASRELLYASAGSPPALYVGPEGESERLWTGGMIVGVEAEAEYRKGSRSLPPGSSLYLFSDGAYEIRLREGGILGLDVFAEALQEGAKRGPRPLLAPLVEELRSLSSSGRFEDDVSIVEFRFGATE